LKKSQIMWKKYVFHALILTGLLISCSTDKSEEKVLSDFVNPFIGASTNIGIAGVAHGLGKTFPGAASPFGLVQVSPNTITGGDNGPGYSYEHKTIEGFAFTQMSGIGWYGDLGNFLVMPTNGPLRTNSGKENPFISGYRSAYDKESETAKAGYYSVLLTDYKIKAEMTAAPHSGMLRFTFSENKLSRIQIDLARRVGGTSVEQYIKIVDDRTIEGWMRCTPEGGGWGNGYGKPDYTVYYYAQFSKPLVNIGVWSVDITEGMKRKREDIENMSFQTVTGNSEVLYGCREKQGKHLGFFTEFATTKDEKVILKAGISFVSIAGARENLTAEIPDWNFDKTYDATRKLWDTALSKISVEGGTEEQKIIFYTALYHSMIDPRAFSDLNGNYPGGDGNIHKTEDFTKRTIFSGWDVFRSQFPLQTIINPDVVNDMINSLVELADENGTHYLERWEFLNAYSGCMIGNPAVAVILDAYNKGIRNFDVQKAWDYSKNSVEKWGNGDKGHSLGISTTLEHSYFEWCLSQFAGELGKPDEAAKYLKRSKSYRNIFDPQKGWFRPKNEDGSWKEWPEKGRLQQNYGCVESNPYQQGWFVPHDIDGLSELLGGKEKTIADLTDFFESSPENMMWSDFYNHPNEPVHQVPFMFNRLGAPWLTQKWVREICERAYHNSVEGYVGNEDVGQMSAWYVLAASGIHPVCPGDTRYEICSPLFDKVTFTLDPEYATGKTFTIITINNSQKNRYIQSAKLNNEPYYRCWIDHRNIADGGVLELQMGDKPNMQWGLSEDILTNSKFEVKEAPEWTALFNRSEGWFGADGIFAMPINGEDNIMAKDSTETLLLFSDTMIGEIKDGKLQPGFSMVNNSVAYLLGSQPEEKTISFHWAKNEIEKPVSFFSPRLDSARKGDYYWLGDGFVNPELKTTYIFAYRMRNLDTGNDWSFTQMSNDLIAFPADSRPPFNDQRQIATPLSFGKEGGFGASIFVNTEKSGAPDPDGYIYVYGVKGKKKHLLVSRVLPENFENFSRWRFWDGKEWNADIQKADTIIPNVSNELSVSALPDGRYVLVYQLNGLSATIGFRLGSTPYGPFGPFTKIWETTEGKQKNIITYNAKAHPNLSAPGELLISYNVNAFDFGNMIKAYPNLYRPRFVRLKFL
jgi:predicted alpha-1,2-mannosidase